MGASCGEVRAYCVVIILCVCVCLCARALEPLGFECCFLFVDTQVYKRKERLILVTFISFFIFDVVISTGCISGEFFFLREIYDGILSNLELMNSNKN